MNQHLVKREMTSEGPRRSGAFQGGRSATVNLRESPVTWLHARGHLTDRQLAAGECLRADWERAQLAPRVTMRWDPVKIDGSPPAILSMGERQLAARARFDGAIAAAGPGLSDILWRVACAGERVQCAEQALGWPTRSGKLVLGLALDRVARFYKVG